MTATQATVQAAFQVREIWTHEGIHFDEALALFLLTQFPCDRFPGAVNAKIKFAGNGILEKSAEDYRKAGVLLVGIGGGELDEHTSSSKTAEHEECAATLTAKAMGLYTDPTLKHLLEYALRVDRGAPAQPYELASLMKAHFQQHGDSQKLWKLARPLIEAAWYKQHQFHACENELSDAKISEFESKMSSNFYFMVAVQSDNPQMNSYLRFKERRTAVIVQRNRTGNVQIFTNSRFHGELAILDMVARIRQAEMFHRGVRRGDIPSSDELMMDGRSEGAECWWFQAEAGNLYNGSLTAPDVSPTRIPWKELLDIVYDTI